MSTAIFSRARARHLAAPLLALAFSLIAAAPRAEAQTAPRDEASARAQWLQLSREERVELLRRFDALHRATPAEKDRLLARSEVLGRRERRLVEELRTLDPQKLEALRALPERERRAELRHLLEQRMESELSALRERLDDAQWQELRQLRGPERSRALARLLREQAHTSERRSLERWTREGVLDPASAEALARLPWEERGPALRSAARRSAVKRVQAQVAQRPELFPEPFWKRIEDLDEQAAISAVRACRERVQRALAEMPTSIPPHLLPALPEMRRFASLPLADRRESVRRSSWRRFEEWARRSGADDAQLERWRTLDLERAVQEAQRWRAQKRSSASARERKR
jgi:hypothetical protein